MEKQEDEYTKSEVSDIKSETELENNGVKNTEFPVTIKNELKEEMLLPEDDTTNEDSKDWFIQMNTALSIENVKHEQIKDDHDLVNCENLKSEPDIKEEEDVIAEKQSQSGMYT
uniref:Uncharacterized protein LOC114348902 n=1 Tax=Diabrotica virgifera virgifera TaxID=50390 RepID=A0A6P7GZJ3_DIAVI